MQQPITVFLADDHSLVREALKRFIDAQPNFEVIGEASSGLELIEKVKQTGPHLVIIDPSMPNFDAIECTASISKFNPDIKVIALTTKEEPSYIRSCLAAGGKGYVLKRSQAADLLSALSVVAAGGLYLDQNVSLKLQEPAEQDNSPLDKLSDREIQVVKLAAKGLSAKDISKHLAISVKTVETYKSRAMEKLELRSRSELIRFAVGNGWL